MPKMNNYVIYTLEGELAFRGKLKECAEFCNVTKQQITNHISSTNLTIGGKYFAFTDTEDEEANESIAKDRILKINHPDWSDEQLLCFQGVYGTEKALIGYLEQCGVNERLINHIVEKINVVEKLSCMFGMEYQKALYSKLDLMEE